MKPEELKKSIIATVQDLVGSFLYYDRKEDEELKVGDIEEAVKTGWITKDEIIEIFKSELLDKME